MKTQSLWTGTIGSTISSAIGSIFVAMGIVPTAQALEAIAPYTPSDLRSSSPASPLPLRDSPRQAEVGLSFDLPGPVKPEVKTGQPPLPTVTPLLPAEWWSMGSDSPLAIAIGMAEGTRTLTGEKTAAYYWHEDPGNGANNFGTFSYQHFSPEKTTEVDRQASGTAKREVAKAQGLPELSDRLQLQRLHTFYKQLQQQAQQKGIQLTPLEILNGLDLANQSEAAALSPWGYIDRLVQMRSLLPGQPEEQIKEARTWAYWSPDRNTWDAPGLGNHYSSIRRDQDRRFAALNAIAKASPYFEDFEGFEMANR